MLSHVSTQLGTALHAAVDGEHEDVVELLLEENINPDLQRKVRSSKGCTNHETVHYYTLCTTLRITIDKHFWLLHLFSKYGPL